MITNEELSCILNQYSLGELSCSYLERMTDGWTNLTFKFHVKPTDKPYILREYIRDPKQESTLEDIRTELNFISYLFMQYNLPVVPMIDPPGIFVIHNGHYCAIFPFIDGIKYVNSPENSVRQLWQTIEIGRFLGHMHFIDVQKFSLTFTRRTINIADIKHQLVNSSDEFDKNHPDLYERIRRIIDENLQAIPLITDELEQRKFEDKLEKNLPKGFIHIDIHDDNVLFSPNQNKIAAVLDFDDMCFGPFLIDIAMTLCFWCSRGPHFDFDYAKEFLVEYQLARKMQLTNDEKALLELYCYIVMLHQILFVVQLKDNERIGVSAINELLLPIEQISKEKKFFEKL